MKNPFARKAKVKGSKKETDTTKEILLGQRIPVEFTKIKQSIDDPSGKRVVTRRMKAAWRGPKHTFIQRGGRLYFVDPAQLQWEPEKGRKRGYWKIQFDDAWCEPLGKDGLAHRNAIVSLILRDESMMQLVQIAQSFLPLTLTRTMIVTVIVFASMAGLIGLGMNEVFHTAPTTIVHWFTTPPVIK